MDEALLARKVEAVALVTRVHNLTVQEDARFVAEAQPQYAPLHEGMAALRAGYTSPKPVGFGSAILKVVEAEKAPLRVFFGEQPLQIASSMYQQRLDEWAAWASVSREAEGK